MNSEKIFYAKQNNKKLIPILVEHKLIDEYLDYFDDYLVSGEENA